jgi:predicted RNA-binding Zn ribbon-like protein
MQSVTRQGGYYGRMFTFISGNRGLDFAGTVLTRVRDHEDLLRTPADLSHWVVAAGLLDSPPHCTSAQLADGIVLREAIYRLAKSAAEGETGAEADRATVNAAAEGALPHIALTGRDGVSRTGDLRAALTAVARAAVELLGTPERDLVKECGRPDCTRLYVDTSRGQSRRWCEMGRCGNRAKSAAFRSRQHG